MDTLHSAASEPQHFPFLLSALYHFLLLISPYSILPYCKFQLFHDAHSQKALPHLLVPGLPYGYLCQDTATSFRRQGRCISGHPSSPPVVDTVHGKVLGKFISLRGFAQPVAVFLGIPFAKPPLGPLRFSPPQPAEPWSFVKNATSYPPIAGERDEPGGVWLGSVLRHPLSKCSALRCAQLPIPEENNGRCSQDAVAGQVLSEFFTNHKENISLKFSEDCLYLNIYTPADLAKKSRLPVMVWIHGGGLFLGGASTYDGLALAAHENVVVVTIQYRLGIWGFFSTGDEHSRGNWGHLDQLAALRWVQDNIASFGGNPGSVTIFGESAGGESVSVLVFSPLAKNLFHRAISESGVALTAVLVEKGDIKPLAEGLSSVDPLVGYPARGCEDMHTHPGTSTMEPAWSPSVPVSLAALCFQRLTQLRSPVYVLQGRYPAFLQNSPLNHIRYFLKCLCQIATIAGCKTTTSAVMVHCLRQKSEEELLETTLKMFKLVTEATLWGSEPTLEGLEYLLPLLPSSHMRTWGHVGLMDGHGSLSSQGSPAGQAPRGHSTQGYWKLFLLKGKGVNAKLRSSLIYGFSESPRAATMTGLCLCFHELSPMWSWGLDLGSGSK
ncbi:Liver carboxylesterase 1 [Saguinus oedipus]|uniref:Carboxylic ester hydrolase n=1 Tax=Saguinus oedipus TaxID=9490 RepID=A0ABQ9TKX1_SAGOE|nr:Liver carboxylesterase 1 [Saguinus oedipus]